MVWEKWELPKSSSSTRPLPELSGRIATPSVKKLVTNNITMEVIGVVGDARYTSLEAEPVPEIYYPQGVFPQDEISLAIRTVVSPMVMADVIRSAIHEVDGDVFIAPFQTMDEVIAGSVSNRRFVLILLSVFSGIGVVLALAGIAGIVAYSLSLRLREVGIRVAIGAGPRDVILLMSRQGLVPAFAGLGLGLLFALGLTRLLRHMLYTVSPYDPVVFVLSIAALGGISVLAAGITAYRACRLDVSSILK
jgi:ABC-type antimicrobial peptide transport system permease subunit